MLQEIEKLLVLQDRDRNVIRTRAELFSIEPQRKSLQSRLSQSQTRLDAAKLRVKQIETERKKLELEVETKKQQIEKYSLQQFQTKKNEEYRALAHEIEMCRETIRKLEDQELELMEQAEVAQKEVVLSTKQVSGEKGDSDMEITRLGGREESLRKHLHEIEAERQSLAVGVEPGTLSRYERLMKNKGGKVVVGVEHGVCGGCHMKLPTQELVLAQGNQQIVTCPNCARILYYTRDMDLSPAD